MRVACVGASVMLYHYTVGSVSYVYGSLVVHRVTPCVMRGATAASQDRTSSSPACSGPMAAPALPARQPSVRVLPQQAAHHTAKDPTQNKTTWNNHPQLHTKQEKHALYMLDLLIKSNKRKYRTWRNVTLHF